MKVKTTMWRGLLADARMAVTQQTFHFSACSQNLELMFVGKIRERRLRSDNEHIGLV